MRAKRGTAPPTPRKDRVKKPRVAARTRKSNVVNHSLTEQRDIRVDYVAPTKQRGYNKSVKKFQTKVMKALQRVHPVVSFLSTLQSTQTLTVASTEQTWQIFHLKPWDGQSAVPGAGSLYNEQAQNDLQDLGGSLSGGIAVPLSDNFTVKYAELELTIQNSQAANDVILELYEIEYVNKAGSPMNQFGSFQAALAAGIAATTTFSGSSAYDLNRQGVTPFDIVALIRDYGIKIVKKVSYVLKADDIISYKMKDYKRHVFDYGALQTDLDNKFCIPGKTKSLLLVSRGTAADAISGFRCAAVKRYQVQPEYANADKTIGGRD